MRISIIMGSCLTLVFLIALSCGKDNPRIKSAGVPCGTDSSCASGFCDTGNCETAVGLLGKTCSEGASLTECGSYICRKGKCRSCESDTQCSDLGLGNTCQDAITGLRACATVSTTESDTTSSEDTSTSEDTTIPEVKTELEGVYGFCAGGSKQRLTFRGNSFEWTLSLPGEVKDCEKPAVTLRFVGTLTIGDEVKTTGGKTAKLLDIPFSKLFITINNAALIPFANDSKNPLCASSGWVVDVEREMTGTQCYFEPHSKDGPFMNSTHGIYSIFVLTDNGIKFGNAETTPGCPWPEGADPDCTSDCHYDKGLPICKEHRPMTLMDGVVEKLAP